MARGRTSLWTDVVGSLALITGLAIVLNAALTFRAEQLRQEAFRGALVEEYARSLAARFEALLPLAGRPDPTDPSPFQAALDAATLPEDAALFAVLTTPGLRTVATRGAWPGDLPEDRRTAWLLEAVDLRTAIASRRPERGEWSPSMRLFGGSGWLTAAAPVREPSGAAVGAVRVVVPAGEALLRRGEPSVLPVLALSVGFTALVVGLFGYLLFRRRILRPIDALAQGTEAVAAGDFRTRLPPGPANELGEVARAFNSMAEALERYRQESEARLAELQETNEDLRKAREDLVFAEKMATVGRLAAGVAHELGNPLASVIGFTELLEQDPDGTLARDFLPRMRKELDRIHGIVGELLAYSRRVKLRPGEMQPLDALEAVRKAVALVDLQPRFAGVRFELDLPRDLPPVLGRDAKLQQVLLNLFVNAAEAIEGKGEIEIVGSRAEAQGEHGPGVSIEVRDRGPGVPEEARDKLFEPFFTTKDVGQGTGLGLSVSLTLVDGMGGTLGYRPRPGGGSIFALRLREAPRPKPGAGVAPGGELDATLPPGTAAPALDDLDATLPTGSER